MLLPLLAVASSLDGAEQIAGGLSRLGLYYVAGIEAVVILGLFTALTVSWAQRNADTRELLERAVTHIQQNTAATLAQTEVMEEMREHLPRRRRAPALDSEPKTGAGA